VGELPVPASAGSGQPILDDHAELVSLHGQRLGPAWIPPAPRREARPVSGMRPGQLHRPGRAERRNLRTGSMSVVPVNGSRSTQIPKCAYPGLEPAADGSAAAMHGIELSPAKFPGMYPCGSTRRVTFWL